MAFEEGDKFRLIFLLGLTIDWLDKAQDSLDNIESIGLVLENQVKGLLDKGESVESQITKARKSGQTEMDVADEVEWRTTFGTGLLLELYQILIQVSTLTGLPINRLVLEQQLKANGVRVGQRKFLNAKIPERNTLFYHSE
ncbi:UNVERIFIED_CONTAM: hypothetical protein BEN50_14085 [Euhalothece sp. KZN 001]